MNQDKLDLVKPLVELLPVSSPDFNATLALLRSIHAVIESIAIPSWSRPGEYLFTVRYQENSGNH